MRLQRNSIICALVFLVSFVLGDVNIVSPSSKATFSPSGGTVSVPVEWMDNGAYPSLSKISTFTFSLCTGPNNNIDCVAVLASKITPSELTQDDKVYSYTAEFASTLTGNGQYYIQVFAHGSQLESWCIMDSVTLTVHLGKNLNVILTVPS